MKTRNRSGEIRWLLPSVAGVLMAISALCCKGAENPDLRCRHGKLVLSVVPTPKYQLGGMVGQRVKNNIDRWLTQAPRANPGLLDMFARRDSGVKPDLVPWAGEFVGKYLISAVQALRMSDDPKLKETVRHVVARLIALQADDGYLGPWPKRERLRGHWDLWGHYHVMLGLLDWSEQTRDRDATAAVVRMADLICKTFLDTDLRVLDAGSPEMNMSIIHGMARLYCKTGNPRYLQMAQQVLHEFEKAGDYYRTGLAGKEFFHTPRPRWESLHCLQGLAALYRITGDKKFRTAFLQHWASMRRFDRRNTGGFSSGERATGNPFKNDAIETCCVVAFQEIMIDALKLTGDSTIADDLESATLNAMLGAQHPSGAWCTYSTPMAGQRIPSHIAIHFQARPDTPQLNCCSVNGPRGYGSISLWGIMRSASGLVVNYYGPMTAQIKLTDGTPVTIRQHTDYPRDGLIELTLDLAAPKHFTLGLRVPGWARRANVSLAGRTQPAVPGSYVTFDRRWHPGDKVTLRLDCAVRYESGDLDQYGKISLYRGPLLLARDDRFAPKQAAAIDVARLPECRVVPSARAGARTDASAPWLQVDVPTVDGKTIRLIDFASAGRTTIDGKPVSSYTTWLAADRIRPPRPVAWLPHDRSAVAPGAIRFVWRRPAPAAHDRKHTIVIAKSPRFDKIVLRYGNATGDWLLVPADKTRILKPYTPYFWKVVAHNANGRSESIAPYKQFRVDPTVPPPIGNWPYNQRERDQMIIAAPLRGTIKPAYGKLQDGTGWQSAVGPDGKPGSAIRLDGDRSMIRYRIARFPETDFTVSIWFRVHRWPNALGQIFSAWAAGMDDPLRLVVQQKQLFARIEAGAGYGTKGVPLKLERWYHVSGVKGGQTLALYLDGQLRAKAKVPATIYSNAENVAVGGNPNFSGAEFLPGSFAQLKFHARALSAREVRHLYEQHQPNRLNR